MSGRVFDASQHEEVRKWLDRGFEKAAERAMVAAAAKLVSTIQNEIIPKEDPQPVDRGLYRAGWRFKKIPKGAEVFNAVPHAPIVEYGARAANVKVGRAMINALTAWVLRKGIVSGKGKAAKNEARQVAFAIANSMRKKGIFNRNGKEGLRILEKALERLGDFLSEEFPAEIRREFEKT